MARLVAERQVGDLQPDGWHYPPIRKLRLRRSRRKPKATSEFEVAEDTADQPTSLEDLAERIRELEQEGDALRATVRRLQDAGKAEIRQREEWRARALAAEAERDRHAGDHDRFDALRRLIARKLHPDYADGGDLEKLLRQEFFKRIWPEIERLATQK